MKTKFELDNYRIPTAYATLTIIGKRPKHAPYVSIQYIDGNGHEHHLLIKDKDLNLIATNILKALKSKKLR